MQGSKEPSPEVPGKAAEGALHVANPLWLGADFEEEGETHL